MNGMNLLMDAARAAHAAGGGGGGSGQWDNSAGMGQPSRPASAAENEEMRDAANLPRMLAETARHVGSQVSATPGQVDTLTLAAAASHVCDPATLVSIPRILITSKYPESGKTHTMRVTASLCYNPMDTTGSWPSVKSGIAEAAQQGSQCPTFFRDEIGKVFGSNGLADGGDLGDIVRQGYLCEATQAWSVNRQRVEFSTFSLFLMTGLRAAVPSDVRTRCIVIVLVPGEPPRYYDLREARAQAKGLNRALGRAVRANREAIRDFRVRDIGHPKLVKRRAEVWEPLFAVAAAADAQTGTSTWRNRCLAAFLEVALDESEGLTLSPGQEIIRDVAAACELIELRSWHGEAFAGGRALRKALRELDPDTYGPLADDVLGCRMRDELTDSAGEPLPSIQVRFGETRVRGYLVRDLTEAWEAIRPHRASDTEQAEFDDPFADEPVTDVTDVTRDGDEDDLH